ncbi:MAG: hypothetical protein WAM62_17015 [Pseudolabrys sp.]
MKRISKIEAFFVTPILLGLVLSPSPASAITAELAKKCLALAGKVHPMAAIGAKVGTAAAHTEYYRACVANNGAVPDNDKQQTAAPAATQPNSPPAAK